MTPGTITDNKHTDTIFNRESADPRVITAHGYGVQLKVSGGNLIVRDGIGANQRERRIPKIDRTLKRIVITGPEGSISIAALRWCRIHGISVITIDPYGEHVSSSPAYDQADGPTVRAQALCMAGGTYEQAGIEIARMIVGRKIMGQARIARDTFGDTYLYNELSRQVQNLEHIDSVRDLNIAEGHAARIYYGRWGNLSIQWKDSDHVPAHWAGFTRRRSIITNENRGASDPINAMLNYAYRMVEVEARLVCASSGLHPSLSYLHVETPYRDALALDLMEVGRPVADRFVLSMLTHPGNDTPREFTRREFSELDSPPGAVRLVAPLTHLIAEQSAAWSADMHATAQRISEIVSSAARGRYTVKRAPNIRPLPALGRGKNPHMRIIPDELWADIGELAGRLPSRGSRGDRVDRRVAIASIIYVRSRRIPYTSVPDSFAISSRTMLARMAIWKRTEEWSKIEATVLEYHLSRVP